MMEIIQWVFLAFYAILMVILKVMRLMVWLFWQTIGGLMLFMIGFFRRPNK